VLEEAEAALITFTRGCRISGADITFYRFQSEVQQLSKAVCKFIVNKSCFSGLCFKQDQQRGN